MANDQDTPFATAAPAPRSLEREKAVVALLRQLASGLSAYRLFPGDLNQASFVQAVQRIRIAAEAALEWGPLETEISGPRFSTTVGPVPEDERIERLALSFYEHRAERFWLRGVPDVRDLGILYQALCTEASEAGGGVGAALRVGGVETLAVREITPQPLGEEEMHGAITEEQRTLWEKLGNADLMSRELLEAVAEQPSTAEAAEDVFSRLEGLLRALPEALSSGFEFYRRLHEVVVRLPKSLRRAVMGLLLSRVKEVPLAERMIGTMTDADLARVLVDQAADGGVDAVDLAKWLVHKRVRSEDLIDLTLALRMGRVEGGTILVGLERVGLEAGSGGTVSSASRAVSTLLARGLVGVGQEDVVAIRDGFPRTAQEQRSVVLGALSDYLRAETDLGRLAEVLGVLADEVATALRGREELRVAEVLAVTRGVLADATAVDKRVLIEAALDRALSAAVLADLVAVSDRDDVAESAIRLLKPFGGLAVDKLMDDLAQERDRGRRALLMAILVEVARGHHPRVARRLSDHRWFVARNVVTVLSRSGGPEVVPALAEASRHKEAAVRREAARGLLTVAGLDALPELMELAADQDDSVRTAVISAMGGLVTPGACIALARLARSLRDQGDRRRALDALARHPAPEALDVLEDLASSRSAPKLPRRIRRYAKSLAKARRDGKS